MVVGGGIAGSALATVLARHGIEVLVLERQEIYTDHVRGEFMVPWGVAVADRLGLLDVLVDSSTRASVQRQVFVYDENASPEEVEAAPIDLTSLIPGVPGALDLGHPEACDALARAAVKAGATLRRGVSHVAVTPGELPEISYVWGGCDHRVRPRLLVAADGRASSVRRQLGIGLQSDPAKTMGSGLLVGGLEDWPVDTCTHGAAGRVHFYVFPQRGGRARLYLQYPAEDHRNFSGPGGVRAFLSRFQLSCLPDSERFAALEPLGPCAGYPWNTTWAETVLAPGVVLVGDAGGYNDPIIGQGLALSLMDVATLSDILLSGPDWSEAAFSPYANERRTRMARARSCALLFSAFFAEFTPEAARRRAVALPKALADENLSMPLVAPFVGYEAFPEEVFEEDMRERILSEA
ncbi:MAG: FAD-dependent monooxygenase [Actinobacteria bacterium]|nr:FAD-dependent monooxygenase [Actinomycetota bacterium]